MIRRFTILFSIFVSCLPACLEAQSWSGIIAPTRAIDWTNAGVPGGIPTNRTQCGSTINPYNGSAATINTAIANCGAGHYVQLGAGTFNLTSGIDFARHSNVTLRGKGANSTFLVFTGAGAGGYNSVVSMEGSISANGYEDNVCDWTGGYSRGSTTLTLTNCGSTTPGKGSISDLHVGSLLILDQLDEASDTGNIWNCATKSVCANTIQGGESRTDGPSNGSMNLRSQQQGVIVTGISGNTVTISPGLYMPNWRASQKPQAWFASAIINGAGLEDLSIDATRSGSNQSVMVSNATNSWVKGIRGIYANRSHVRFLLASHSVLRDSYFYQNQSHASVSYGAELMGGWDNLVENNIFQQDTDSEPSCSGACAGNVIAYNFDINNVWTQSSGWMQAGYYQHAAGDVFNLWEGNIGPGYNADDVHGTHHFETIFRNYLIGQNQGPCGGTTCNAQTVPIQLYAGSRYMNVLGNVLGLAGYHTNYTCMGGSSPCANGTKSIYTLGATGNGGGVDGSITGFCLQPSCSSRGSYDPQVAAYLLRWGNYDVVSNTVKWSASEVPTALAQFPNSVPSSTSLPTSFYLKAKPTWFGSVVFPAIGPDVNNGNIGGVNGHANMNPAMVCYSNVMRGPADGTGGVLPFTASSCYGSSTQNIAPPTALTTSVR